jgi:3-methyladenine DNA glycosylase AlkD
LPLIERAAADERNFVKKGVSWALRRLGRRNITLNKAALELAERLAKSSEASSRWIGREALRELNGKVVMKQLAAKRGSKERTKKS